MTQRKKLYVSKPCSYHFSEKQSFWGLFCKLKPFLVILQKGPNLFSIGFRMPPFLLIPFVQLKLAYRSALICCTMHRRNICHEIKPNRFYCSPHLYSWILRSNWNHERKIHLTTTIPVRPNIPTLLAMTRKSFTRNFLLLEIVVSNKFMTEPALLLKL